MNQDFKEEDVQNPPPDPPRLNLNRTDNDTESPFKNFKHRSKVIFLGVSGIFCAILSFFQERFLLFIGFSIFSLYIFLYFGFLNKKHEDATSYLYDRGIAAFAAVIDIFLDINKDASGDTFLLKVK